MSATTRYAYRAAHADGAFEHGVLAAESRDAALRALAEQGLWAIDLNLARSDDDLRARLSSADLALGLRVLAALLESGLPVSKALAAMPDLAPDAWQSKLPSLARAVREGASLGAAMERSRLAIPAVVLGIVRAGEAGSGLARAVRRAADLMDEAAATRAAVRAALIYPCILAVAGHETHEHEHDQQLDKRDSPRRFHVGRTL
jgi:type II secretory pathway component PulF